MPVHAYTWLDKDFENNFKTVAGCIKEDLEDLIERFDHHTHKQSRSLEIGYFQSKGEVAYLLWLYTRHKKNLECTEDDEKLFHKVFF